MGTQLSSESTRCGVVICRDAGTVWSGRSDAKHGFTVDELALVMAAFDSTRRRENNLCQVAGCGVNALPAYISPVVGLISEAHQATASKSMAHSAWNRITAVPEMVTSPVGYLELSPSHQLHHHAPMAPLMAFNTQHVAIVG